MLKIQSEEMTELKVEDPDGAEKLGLGGGREVIKTW